MFERFSDPARRVVFFARYEAGLLGGATITTEHLLLGLLRENAWLVEPLLTTGHTLTELRRAVERAASSEKEKLGMYADMRLDELAQKALMYADEESRSLHSPKIDIAHLLLGLLRTQDSKAAHILNKFGLKVDEVRLKAGHDTVSPVPELFGAVVCQFYGIEIRFDVAADDLPRVIAEYRGHLATIEIDPVRVIQSDLPARAETMVLEWAQVRKDEINAAWEAGKAGKRPPPISPLE